MTAQRSASWDRPHSAAILSMSRRDAGWALLCAASVAAALLATVRAGWWAEPVWHYTPGLERFLWTLGALSALALALPARHVRAGAAMAALLIAAASSGPAATLGCLALLACAWVAGDAALRWLDDEVATGLLRDLLAITAGFAVIALGINAAVFFPINSTAAYAAAAILVLAAGARRIGARLVEASKWLRAPTALPWPTALLLRAVLVLAGLHLLVASFPELGHDALSMHLAIPHLVALEGRWSFDVDRFVWAVMPMNVNWLYTAASFLGGESAARLLNAGSALLVAAAIVAWSTPRLGQAGALAAAAFWLSMPLSFLESNSAFIELPLTLLVVGALLANEAAARRMRPGTWLIAGALFGSAVAAKLPALLIAPGLGLIWAALTVSANPAGNRIKSRSLFAALSAGAAGTTLFVAPPYLTGWVRTGNPVFPFFNQTFRSPQFDTTTSFTNPLFVHPFDAYTLVDLTLRTTRFIESQHSGALGIAFLALVPIGLAAAALRREGWVWVLGIAAATFCALVFREQVYLRYIVPVLPLMCLVAAYALTVPRSASTAAVLALMCVAVALARFPVASFPLVWFPVQVLGSEAAREDFLRLAQPEQLAAQAAARLSSGDGAGLAMLGVTPAVARGSSLVVTDTWHANAFHAALMASGAEALPQLLLMRGIAWIVLPAQRDQPHLEKAAEVSLMVTRFGNVELRRLDASKVTPPELLRDPHLNDPVTQWGIAAADGGPEGRGAWVTLARPATQRIAVQPGARVRLEVDYVCPTPAEVRSQINWLDGRGRFLGTSIEVARCEGEKTVASVGSAPPGATAAIVYGTPHAEAQVLVRRISARPTIAASAAER